MSDHHSPTIESLLEQAHDYAAHKHDTTVHSRDFYFGVDGRLAIPNPLFGAVTTLGMENLAISQLGARLGPSFWDTPNRTLPSDFYRQLYRTMPDTFAKLTNDLLDQHDGKMLLRGYGDNVRAVLTDRYACLDNVEMLEMTKEVIDHADRPVEIVQSGRYYSMNDGCQRDEMAIRIIVRNVEPAGEDTPYGLGVLIRNGETGGSASEVRPLIMRHSCHNSIVFKTDEEGESLGLRLPHRGQKETKSILLAAAIQEALPIASAGLNRFLQTKMKEIDLGAAIDKLGDEYGWGQEMQMAVAVGSEGHSSLYGLINGITYSAHELEIDQSARLDLESMAATLVTRPHLIR